MRAYFTGRRAARRAGRVLAVAVAGALVGMLPACASGTGGAIEVEQFKDTAAPTTNEYVVRIGDVLSVQVYNDERASGRGRVRTDGRISLPFLDDVDAAGRTPVQLAGDIEKGLSKFLVDPRVTVSVEDASPVTISVLGEVARPGPQPLQGNAGVADALAAAGGLTPFAHKNRIFVVRNRPQQVRIHFTYEALIRAVGQASLFRLLPGDVVVVE